MPCCIWRGRVAHGVCCRTTFPITIWYITTFTNGAVMAHWRKSTQGYAVSCALSKAPILSRPLLLSTVKAPRRPTLVARKAMTPGKEIKGRKRHILTDKLGITLLVVVHAANIQDRDDARLLMYKAKDLFPRLTLIWADRGYAGKFIAWTQIVKRTELHRFVVLPHRWVAERTFGWLGR